MKSVAVALLGVFVLLVSGRADAASFLSIDVGGTTVSCTSTAVCGAGFTIGGGLASEISFTGSVNGVNFTSVQLVSNSPGGVVAFASDTKTAAINTSATTKAITIGFAVNGYSSPAGSPVFFNAAQGVDSIIGGPTTENFTGWGIDGNNLTVGVGTASVTAPCTVPVAPPTDSCATNGTIQNFVRVSPTFSLSGRETFSLLTQSAINAHGSVLAAATAIPEPATMLLLGTGSWASRQARRRRQQTLAGNALGSLMPSAGRGTRRQAAPLFGGPTAAHPHRAHRRRVAELSR